MLRSFLIVTGSVLGLLACSTSDDGAAATSPPGPTPMNPEPMRACVAGTTECVGAQVRSCEAHPDGSTTWTAAVDCAAEQACREGACAEPTAAMKAQADALEGLVDGVARITAWHEPVDIAAVKKKAREEVLLGDGEDVTFVASAWHVMNAFPQGHSDLHSSEKSVCGKTVPYQNSSRFGVCGRPGGGGIVVTYAAQGNELGLAPGDVVVSADGDAGAAMLDKAYARPVCGSVFPAASGRAHAAAASFFGTVPTGAKLTVKSANGAMREVTVTAGSTTKSTSCIDPFARNRQIYAEATTRPDGVAVIRLPSFFPYDKSLPANATQAEFDAFVATYQGEIQKVFDSVKTAKAIVWDARGNTGGITTVGLAIVNGFATAKATNISYCRDRVFGSATPEYDANRYAQYAVAPGGPFAYAGKVALVVDGLAYSAGDYFPRAAKVGGGALVVGSASAGAYGGGRNPLPSFGMPKLDVNVDVTACFDAANDQPLEGAPLAPSVAVEYDPADLSAGKDTPIERAVEVLGL